MAVAVLFVFGALAHEGEGLVFGQFLEEAQCEFLAVVFDGAVFFVDGAVGEKFGFVALGEFGPVDFFGFEGAQCCFGRA